MVGLPRSRHRSLWVYCLPPAGTRRLDALTTLQVVEADAGEFSERDGEYREVDAGDAEAEGEEPDDRAAGGGNRESPLRDRATDAMPYSA
jgi:hypothetical protein